MLKREKWWKNNTIIIKKKKYRNGDYTPFITRASATDVLRGPPPPSLREEVKRGRGNGVSTAREGAANGRDNPSRSLPQGPLIKINPVNWGVWPTLARPQTPLYCILSAFRPPDDRHWSEPILVFVFHFPFSFSRR